MAWHTQQLSPDAVLIQDGERVVGSMRLKKGHLKVGQWHVEILWSGQGGDLTYRSADYTTALAFVEGVETVLSRMVQRSEPDPYSKLPKLRRNTSS